MKISFARRILMILHWMASVLVFAGLVVALVAPGFASRCLQGIEASLGAIRFRFICGILLAVFAALIIGQAMLLFRRRKHSERGFIIVTSDGGGVIRIAVSAIEQMVRQSVYNIDGIADMRIDISSADDAIGIEVNASILNGVNVPATTMNMQRAIRQFVEMSCGVSVQSVSININEVSTAQEAPKRRRAKPGPSEPARFAGVEPLTPEPFVGETPAPASEAREAADAMGMPVDSDPGDAAAVVADAGQAADFDLHYESEFAKDLAAMKAAEEGGEGRKVL